MKKKTTKDYGFLKFWLFYIVYHIIQFSFEEEIKYYYSKIPSSIITASLVTLLLYIIYKTFSLNDKKEKEILLITSENDYYRKDATKGFTALLVIVFLFYFFMVDEFSVNSILFFLIILTISISNSSLRKTVSFQLKGEELSYKNEKEIRTFIVNEINEIKITASQIYLIKESSEELLSFLKLNKYDYREIKEWFQQNMPNVKVLNFDSEI